MAAGDVTPKYIQSGHAGGFTNPKMVTATVEFGDVGTGQTTVTAAEVGLSKIEGFVAGVWGSSTGVGEFVYTTTSFATGGVTSVALECINDASALVDRTVSMIFWGQ